MFNTSIRREVMKVLNARLKDAQKVYDEEVAQLKDERVARRVAILEKCDDDLEALEDSHEVSKSQLLNTHVTNALNSIK